GGKEISEGTDLGEMMFGAALGSLAAIRDTQQSLHEESEQLFLPRGRNQRIYDGLHTLSEIRLKFKNSLVSSEEYRRCEESLLQTERQKRQLEGDKQELTRSQLRLARIRS